MRLGSNLLNNASANLARILQVGPTPWWFVSCALGSTAQVPDYTEVWFKWIWRDVTHAVLFGHILLLASLERSSIHVDESRIQYKILRPRCRNLGKQFFWVLGLRPVCESKEIRLAWGENGFDIPKNRNHFCIGVWVSNFIHSDKKNPLAS